MTRHFASIAPGDELPALVKTPTTEQLVRYAGAAADPARIHYDEAAARARGFDGVIVHGLLKAAFLGELLTTWCGEEAWVQRFATQYRGVDFPGRPLVCRARVTATDGRTRVVEVDMWTENLDGQVTTRGSATVVFRPPPGRPPAGPTEEA